MVSLILRLPRIAIRHLLRPFVIDIIQHDMRIWGDKRRVRIARSARMTNAQLNVSSGTITVGEYTFTGHNVSLITGRHFESRFMAERMLGVPHDGHDIVIGNGVWICSNATIIGPCNIGDHAVVAAGAVVTKDVPAYAIVAGVPARILRIIDVRQ